MNSLLSKIILFAFLVFITSSQPTLVIEVSRYGARSPTSDQFTNSWPYQSELTPVGMRQQYILGAAIAANYPQNVLYNPATIWVQSEDNDLALMSAYSQVYGTYNGTGYNLTNISASFTYPPYNKTLVAEVANGINFTSALPNNFMPIPIHAVEHDSDYVLEAYSNCPAFEQTIQNNMNNSVVQSVYSTMAGTIAQINQNLSQTSFGVINNPSSLYNFSDLAVSSLYAGLPPPANIPYNSSYFTDIAFFAQWYSVYPYLASTQLIQLLSAPLIWQINDYINGVVNGSSSLQYILLSTDEVTLMSFLAAFGVVTPTCLQANWVAQRQNQPLPNPNCTFPSFSSQLIIEFYNQSNSVSPHVIFRYNDVPMNICPYPGGGVACPLNVFINASSTATNGQGIYEFLDNCGLIQNVAAYSFYSNSIVLPIVLSITALTLLAVLIMLIKKKKIQEKLMYTEDEYVTQRLQSL